MMKEPLVCYAIALLIVTGCAQPSDVCTQPSFPGSYLLSSGRNSYIVSLRANSSGEFFNSVSTHSLQWNYVPKHNLLELNLESGDFEILSGMMGLSRPTDAVRTERGITALTPVCDQSGRAVRLELKDDDLAFLRQ
jgi:hypothetical protein